MTDLFLSVILPVYNENKRIGSTLNKISQYLDAKDVSYELLVVDDGSTDNSVSIVQSFLGKNSGLRLIRLPQNEGKGSAVKRGVMESRGRMVYFTDADLSTPIEEIEKFFPLFPTFDIVIGSRAIEGADLRVREPFHREILGKIFNKFVRVLCVSGFVDTQCGAKMFSRAAAQAIFHSSRLGAFLLTLRFSL